MNEETEFSLGSYSHNHICGIIRNGNGEEWQFIGIYGWLATEDKWRTWELLRNLLHNSNTPTVVPGDFNEILPMDEKEGGSRIEPRNCRGFRDVCGDLGLVDLGFSGPKFTWERSTQNGGTVRERLDRGLCTIDWRTMFPTAGGRVLPRHSSGHSPLLISTTLGSKFGGSRPLMAQTRKFKAMWLDHEEGRKIILDCWEKGCRP